MESAFDERPAGLSSGDPLVELPGVRGLVASFCGVLAGELAMSITTFAGERDSDASRSGLRGVERCELITTRADDKRERNGVDLRRAQAKVS